MLINALQLNSVIESTVFYKLTPQKPVKRSKVTTLGSSPPQRSKHFGAVVGVDAEPGLSMGETGDEASVWK